MKKLIALLMSGCLVLVVVAKQGRHIPAPTHLQ
jgi:hypothetical protein